MALVNPLLISDNITTKYRCAISGKSILYHAENQEKDNAPAWRFCFSDTLRLILSSSHPLLIFPSS
jgi:hypothetical protein